MSGYGVVSVYWLSTLPLVWLWRGEFTGCVNTTNCLAMAWWVFTGCQHYQLSGYGVVSVYWLSTLPTVWLWRGEWLLAVNTTNCLAMAWWVFTGCQHYQLSGYGVSVYWLVTTLTPHPHPTHLFWTCFHHPVWYVKWLRVPCCVYLIFENGSGCAGDVCGNTQCDYVNMTVCHVCQNGSGMPVTYVGTPSVVMLTWLCVLCGNTQCGYVNMTVCTLLCIFQNGSGCASDVWEGTWCDYVKMTVCTLCIRTVLGMPMTCVGTPSVIMLTWLCVPCASERFWGCQWRVRKPSVIMLTWLCVPCASEWFWGCQWRVWENPAWLC